MHRIPCICSDTGWIDAAFRITDMQDKITVLVDNKPSGDIKGEWGLSILVEHEGKKILLDTGGSGLFAVNLKKLGYDPADIDYGVLSHAHCDHANGMPRFFEENSKAKFYLRESAAENCYGKIFFCMIYFGIKRHVLERYSDRIEFVSGDYRLCEGAYLIPHKTPGLAEIGRRGKMYIRTDRGWKPDDLSHEQSLVIETDKGLLILNSCSHGGAVNIINEVAETFPGKKIYGLIGGLHLFNKSSEEIREVGRKIKESGISYVLTGHCTKDRAYGILKEELGDSLQQLRSGLQIEF